MDSSSLVDFSESPQHGSTYVVLSEHGFLSADDQNCNDAFSQVLCLDIRPSLERISQNTSNCLHWEVYECPYSEDQGAYYLVNKGKTRFLDFKRDENFQVWNKGNLSVSTRIQQNTKHGRRNLRWRFSQCSNHSGTFRINNVQGSFLDIQGKHVVSKGNSDVSWFFINVNQLHDVRRILQDTPLSELHNRAFASGGTIDDLAKGGGKGDVKHSQNSNDSRFLDQEESVGQEADDTNESAERSEAVSRPRDEQGDLFMHTVMQSLVDERFQMALTAMQPDGLSAPKGEGNRARTWLWNNQPHEETLAPDAYTVQLEKALQRLHDDRNDIARHAHREPSVSLHDGEGEDPDFATLVAELGLSGHRRDTDEAANITSEVAEQMLFEIDKVAHPDAHVQDNQCPQQ